MANRHLPPAERRDFRFLGPGIPRASADHNHGLAEDYSAVEGLVSCQSVQEGIRLHAIRVSSE
jgi:hypothetical protein